MLSQIIDNQNKLLLEKEQEIAELKDKLNNLESVAEVRLANWQKYEKRLKEAKDLIRNLLRVTYGEGWNYSLDVKVKAEDFLKKDNNEQART